MTERVVIVGSGMAGLTAAALLTKEGYQVTLLEAAAEWGGCASKFQRKNFRFATGATLAMGYEKEGIHDRINRQLGIRIATKPLEEAMQVKIGGIDYPYYTSRSRLLKMWDDMEPEYAERIHRFYSDIWETGRVLANHMKYYPVIPPKNTVDIGAVLSGLSVGSIKLIPRLNQTLKQAVDKYNLNECKSFIHFIDGTLMDSMQTTHEDVSYLMGAAALNVYHEGSFYIEGGLYEQAEAYIQFIKEHGGKVLKPRRVREVLKHGEEWLIKDHRGNEYNADHVVLNTGLGQLKGLLSSDVYQELPDRVKSRTNYRMQWGAFTQYFAVEETCIPDNAASFYQIMVDPNLPAKEDNHFFVSLSGKNDEKRAPKGYRTITVSTHIDLRKWQTKQAYDHHSEKMKVAVAKELETLFPGFESALIQKESGGPIAWERFTFREKGGVGGFPMTKEFALWNAVSHRTPMKGLWLCGDNVFPGAGSIGAASSGVHAARSIARKRLV
ncbi:phytoene desaturase family protein [Salisediminibacterium selenitireducens]|uniref:FAD dependent oxidoreductase n=1 Tax=Bacillus selenitireducens (strain ATCC 700615 / DSM 15326 / MLS10) TaxID=439292 RepID=D6XUQ2_BACIE|nr:FAD-dependent oxidoreductase [Salisediminibacterium selenitireducens]ADH99538.1 FAD dependent oxidoreductase [[Bacillus] selenitireducens MLS10]